jgi:hypothetical protein
MEEVIVSRVWMALVFSVMVLYVAIGFVGVKVKARRDRTDEG